MSKSRNGRSRARAAPIEVAAAVAEHNREAPIEHELERNQERQKDLDRRMCDCLNMLEMLREITSETYWESLGVRIAIEEAERATGARR